VPAGIGIGQGALSSLENVVKCFGAANVVSVEVLMHYFQKMSVSAGFTPDPTGAPPLDPGASILWAHVASLKFYRGKIMLKILYNIM